MNTPRDPTRAPERSSDDLEEYGGDFRRFEPLPERVAQGIQRRRRPEPPPPGPPAAEQAGAAPRARRGDPALPDEDQGPVRLTSRGRTLIVGADPDAVAACGLRLAGHQPCLMVVEGSAPPGEPRVRPGTAAEPSNGLLWVRRLRIRGGLGHFRVSTRIDGRKTRLGKAFAGSPDRFDLVLDLRPAEARDQALPPPGYFVSGGGGDALKDTLQHMARMTGDFEKPRFVNLAAAACAGPAACNLCGEACPTKAIASRDGVLQIDHAACPGCGLCAAVCPTGALHTRHPTSQELLVAVHGRIADARLEHRTAPTVIFRQAPEDHASWSRALLDGGNGDEALSDPERAKAASPVVSFPLRAVGCSGPEIWLGALAYGAGRVIVELPPSYPSPMKAVLAGQQAWAAALVKGLGHSPRCLQLKAEGDPLPSLKHQPVAETPVADFDPFQSKRTLIRSGAAHLAACAEPPRAAVELPAGAPFGTVVLDSTACTLCTACCGVCPTGALGPTGGAPELHLLESECIQCGRCRQTCPEQALALAPRLVWDRDRAERPRRLYAQAPAACTRCGRPFAPPALLARLHERLEGHWMYRREEDRRRLSMCRECRVRDLFGRPLEEET